MVTFSNLSPASMPFPIQTGPKLPYPRINHFPFVFKHFFGSYLLFLYLKFRVFIDFELFVIKLKIPFGKHFLLIRQTVARFQRSIERCFSAIYRPKQFAAHLFFPSKNRKYYLPGCGQPGCSLLRVQLPVLKQ